MGLTFGKFKIDDTVKDDITMLICSQYQEEVPATLTFSVPSLSLDPSRPPVLHEEGAKVVRRTSYNFQSLFGPQEVNGSSTLDAFFQYLEHGLDGRPLEEYVGVANRLDLVNATQHLYRQFMVQVINQEMRLNATNSTTQDNAVTQIGTKLSSEYN